MTSNTPHSRPARAVRPLALALSLLLGLALLPTGPAEAQKKAPAKDVSLTELMRPSPVPDLVYGKEDAPITIVEYASLTCGFCGQFHAYVMPKIKTKYIDTGLAKLHLRPFAGNNLDAAGWLLAHCAGPQKGALLASALFERQKQWAFVPNPVPKLFDFAKQAGFTDQTFNSCIRDEKKLQALMVQRDTAYKRYGVDATPTFFINGKRFQGASIEEFEKAMEPHLPKK